MDDPCHLTADNPSLNTLLTRLHIEPAKGLWINGAWQTAASRVPVTNPATGDTLVEVGLAEAAAFEAAIDGAHSAFLSWRNTPATQRGTILADLAKAVRASRDDLATLLVLEQGKTLPQALGEIDYAATFFDWFADQARQLGTQRVEHPEPGRAFLVEPMAAGVAGLITPWNFPFAQGAKKIAAAFAAGCTAVWKPSELTPLVALAMADLSERCGVPPGVLQILPAFGPVAGAALAADARVRVVSVTGSVPTGQAVYAAAATHLQRVTLELGGNAPFIVLDDLDAEHERARTIDDLCRLKLFVSGQVCVTANRIFVPEPLVEVFTEQLVATLETKRLGSGLAPDVDAGPLIHPAAVERVSGLVADAVAQGARVVYENRSFEESARPRGSSFHPVVVLRGVADDMRIAAEEAFGPVFSILSYASDAEVVARANATRYGLAAYVYGKQSGAANGRLRRIAAQLEAGIIGINEWRPLKARIPFGGVKMSGIGAEGGDEGIREFLSHRVTSHAEDPEAGG